MRNVPVSLTLHTAVSLREHSPRDVAEASSFLESILGDACTSTFSVLSSHLASHDPALPPLLHASAANLRRTPALLPSPSLNSTLCALVASLLSPHDAATSAALSALLADPQNEAWHKRAAAVRRVAAAAEDLLEVTCANHALAQPRHSTPTLSSIIPTFPYISNYEILAEAEAQILERALDKPLSGPIAFVGSGPLPLSGIVLTVNRGIPLVLVDVDQGAVKISRSVVRMLEEAGIVKPGMVKVVCADAKDVKYTSVESATSASSRSSSDSASSDSLKSIERGVVVACEAVIVASLVPVPAKIAIAEAVASSKDGPRVVLVRSAVGMVAQVAYEKVSWEHISRAGLQYLGEWIPQRGGEIVEEVLLCVAQNSDRDGRRPNRQHHKATSKSDVLLGFIDGRVLNSVEVFCIKS